MQVGRKLTKIVNMSKKEKSYQKKREGNNPTIQTQKFKEKKEISKILIFKKLNCCQPENKNIKKRIKTLILPGKTKLEQAKINKKKKFIKIE